MAETDRALFVRVTGRVQGVGYRAFTQQEAASRGITGWVVNREDGAVEAALLGDGTALADLVVRLRQGPSGSRVDGVDVRSTDRGRVAEAPADAHKF